MEVLHQRCAGLDVHKRTVVAAVRIVNGNKVTTEVRTFPTTMAGLLALSDWLSENGVTHVAMEATGVAKGREVGFDLATAVDIVSTHPGISTLSAQAIVSETGTDMSRFATAGHLLSWTGLCPRNDESAGRRRSNRLRKGAQWLKTTMVQRAQAAKNKKGSYYQAQYLRLRSRRGPQKAICAVAASILTAIYHMLKNGTVYQDLGADHFNRRSKITQTQRLVKRLEHLGYAVEIQPLAA
jgi:transposase